jgi:hypothetical protein
MAEPRRRAAADEDRASRDPARNPQLARKAVWVQWWTRAWGVVGAILLVYLAATLPDHIRAEDTSALLRSAGLALISLNLVLQAARPTWPIVYALPMTVFGMTVWLVGWL